MPCQELLGFLCADPVGLQPWLCQSEQVSTTCLLLHHMPPPAPNASSCTGYPSSRLVPLSAPHCACLQHFVDDALALLDPAKNASVQQLSNLKQFVSEVVIACRREAMDSWQDTPAAPSPLLSYFLRKGTVTQVLDYSLAGNKNCLAYGVEILLELVREPPVVDDEAEVSAADHTRHQAGTGEIYDTHSPSCCLSPSLFILRAMSAEVREVLQVLAPRYAELHALVLSSQRTEPLHTASGVLTKPIGRLRLSIVHLVVELMQSKDHDIETEVMKHGTLNVLLVGAQGMAPFAHP